MVQGYIRESNIKLFKETKSIEKQRELLLKAGADKIAIETTLNNHQSSVLKSLLYNLKNGDTLIVCSLDRIALSLQDAINTIKEFDSNGINVYILNLGKISTVKEIKSLLPILEELAIFEYESKIEMLALGKLKAKKNEDFNEGRPKIYNEDDIEEALYLLKNNTYEEVSKITGISKSTLQRAKRKKQDN